MLVSAIQQCRSAHLYIPLLPLPSSSPSLRWHGAPAWAPCAAHDLSPALWPIPDSVRMLMFLHSFHTPSPVSVSTSSILYICVSIPSLQIGCGTYIPWNSIQPLKNTFESVLVKWMNLEPVRHSEVRKRKTNIVC